MKKISGKKNIENYILKIRSKRMKIRKKLIRLFGKSFFQTKERLIQ